MVDFDVKGISDFSKDVLEAFQKKYPNEAQKFLTKNSRTLKKIARNNTPEGEGLNSKGQLRKHMKDSWTIKKISRKGNDLSISVGNTSPHAHLVEDGHVVKNEYGTYGFTPGYHTLEKSIEEFEGDFVNEVNELVEKVINEFSL